MTVYAFLSKDENLAKAHVQYLEGRLIEEALKAGRHELSNKQNSGTRLPEADKADMEVYLDRIRQLLPVLGSEILRPVASAITAGFTQKTTLMMVNRGLEAKGRRTQRGFVVLAGSKATAQLRESAEKCAPLVLTPGVSEALTRTVIPASEVQRLLSKNGRKEGLMKIRMVLVVAWLCLAFAGPSQAQIFRSKEEKIASQRAATDRAIAEREAQAVTSHGHSPPILTTIPHPCLARAL